MKGRLWRTLLVRGLLVLLLVLLGVAGVVWYTDPFRLWSPVAYDVATSPVALLPPGTVVGETAPDGWTHLILKNRPRVASGAVSSLSKKDVRYATFLFLTTVARVSPRKSSFRTTYVLDEVAIGLGMEVYGKDVVLSPDTQAELGARLGWIFRQILAGAYKKQEGVRVVARAPTFALLDTPCLMLRHGKHVDVTLRYAVLVEPSSGRLDTLVYQIDRADRPDEVIGPIEWLPPNLVSRSPLHIDDSEFIFGIPTEKVFAAEGMPPGKHQLHVSGDLKQLAAQKHFTTAEAQQLHAGLRRLMNAVDEP